MTVGFFFEGERPGPDCGTIIMTHLGAVAERALLARRVELGEAAARRELAHGGGALFAEAVDRRGERRAVGRTRGLLPHGVARDAVRLRAVGLLHGLHVRLHLPRGARRGGGGRAAGDERKG